MNLYEALSIVRNCSLISAQMRTRRGISAIKIIDRKLVSLERKAAWRSAAPGEIPRHMTEPRPTAPLCSPEGIVPIGGWRPECEICSACIDQGSAVFRINARFGPGIYRCRVHLTPEQAERVDPEVIELANYLRPPEHDPVLIDNKEGRQ